MTGPRFPIQGQEVVPPSPASGAGRVNPYRGYDVHGVTSPDIWQDVQAPDTQTAHAEPYQEPVEHEPVPVRIVTASPQERKVIRVHQEPTDNTRPVRILTRDDRRFKARIKLNEGAAVLVWLSQDSTVGPMNGYPLFGGETLDLDTQGQVWAIADAPPDPRKIIVLEQISVYI